MTTSATVDLDGVLDDIRSGLDTAARDVNALIDGVNAVLGLLPAPVAGYVIDQISQAVGPFTLAHDELDHLLAFAGHPSRLSAAAQTWVGDVARLVSGVAATANVNVMAADDKWSGAAADAYRSLIPLQAAALTAVTTASTEINTTLEDFAAGLVSFWTAIGGAVASLGVALIALVVGVLAVETVIGAVAAFVVAAGAFVAAVTTAVTAYASFNQKQAVDAAVLTNRLNTNTAFPGGTWPRSTNDLTDASITDGDGTDWSLEK